MFHLEDMDKIIQARLLESFVPTLDSSEDATDVGDISRYAITITNTKQYQLVVQYLAAGLSFHQVTSGYGDERGTRHREHWLVL